jgi:hypothetical protein
VTPNQIHISAIEPGYCRSLCCFTCDDYVWDCDHLIAERLVAPRVPALEPSPLQSLAYDGQARVLEVEFRVRSPYAYDELPLPPPPNVIQVLRCSALCRHEAGVLEDGMAAGAVLGVSHPNAVSMSDGTDGVPTATDLPVRGGTECSPPQLTIGVAVGPGSDEGGIAANSCAEACRWAGRVDGMPELRRCRRNSRQSAPSELSVVLSDVSLLSPSRLEATVPGSGYTTAENRLRHTGSGSILRQRQQRV